MEYIYRKGEIIYPDKELTSLDKTVFKFLTAVDFRYVIISGYIAILFGRSRVTEDVDMFIERISEEKLDGFCRRLHALGFYLLDAEDSKDAYERLVEGFSIRFAENGTTEPNFELKFPKRDTDYYSMDHPVRVILDKEHTLITSPIELQIAYKLYLGSEKDELDAKHLYGIFKDNIDLKTLKGFISNLGIKSKYVEEVLGEKFGKMG